MVKENYNTAIIGRMDYYEKIYYYFSFPGKNVPVLLKPDSYHRQNYLDSLDYLMDLKSYYNISLEDQKEVNSNASNYYKGCYNEMNKIYQLCLEKLSEDELEILRTTQQK